MRPVPPVRVDRRMAIQLPMPPHPEVRGRAAHRQEAVPEVRGRAAHRQEAVPEVRGRAAHRQEAVPEVRGRAGGPGGPGPGGPPPGGGPGGPGPGGPPPGGGPGGPPGTEKPSAETRRHSFRLIRDCITGLGWRYKVYATGFILMSLVFMLPPLLLQNFTKGITDLQTLSAADFVRNLALFGVFHCRLSVGRNLCGFLSQRVAAPDRQHRTAAQSSRQPAPNSVSSHSTSPTAATG